MYVTKGTPVINANFCRPRNGMAIQGVYKINDM